MKQMIFVNLPVADLNVSRAFFGTLGYSFDERFCDENALCLVISDTIVVMLMRRDFFAGFTPHRVVDAHRETELLLCLSAESREAVDRLVGRALAAGGLEVRNPMDEEVMYGRSFADPDGHVWEVLAVLSSGISRMPGAGEVRPAFR